VPGEIAQAQEDGARLLFAVRGAVDRPYYVLVNGLKHKPQLKLNGKPVEVAPPHQFLENEGALILKLQGGPVVEVE
jgi:hypothetical protein